MEMTFGEINVHINQNGPEMIRRLVPLLRSPDVLRELVKESVLLDHQELALRCESDLSTRCTNFLDMVKGGSVAMYYNLVKVAKLNNQTDLVKLLVPTEKQAIAQDPAPMTQPMAAHTREAVDSKPDWKAVAKSMQEELMTGGVELLGVKGIGGLAADVFFIRHLRTLKILGEYNIEEIETYSTKADKADKLIKCLLPCKPTKYILLAWVLVEMDQEHLLGSITKDIRKYLRKLSKDGILQLEEEMD